MLKSAHHHLLHPVFKILLFTAGCFIFLAACNSAQVDVADKEIVDKPEDIDAKAEAAIRGTLSEILQNSSDLPDSFRIRNAAVVQSLYEGKSFRPLWSSKGVFLSGADSLLSLVEGAKAYGLFPDDYYYTRLASLKAQLTPDTARKEKKLDAALWAYSDLLLTSAFVQVVKDIRIGRLVPDSVIAKDSAYNNHFFAGMLQRFHEAPANDSFAAQLEPRNADYHQLKEALRTFLPRADFTRYTYVAGKDSAALRKLLYRRLTEEDSLGLQATGAMPDSATLARTIRQYQRLKKLKEDGKISTALIGRLNSNDRERFIRIAINLDRYKLLPPLPSQYLWVNLPSFYLQMRDSDTVALLSRIVVGKPNTRTPIITSAISDMITYPKWHIPESIIKKEILPGLKRDAGYTRRRGFSLVDGEGNEIDPYSVDWSKYKNGIPYRVVQGSGDDNALGVMKFNFPNEDAVYLHDTNQRYLFSRASRALSHGCVRVQSWNALAQYILRNDSLKATNAVPVDSLQSWLVQKQKHYIPVRKPIPLFIRYFTCDVKDGGLVFYEDIYGEDRKLRDRLFSNK